MRHEYTPSQIRMLILRAESQLERTVAQALASDPACRHIARADHMPVHETVVSLIKLFREHIPGAADCATLIARHYAKGADARAGAPTVECLRAICEAVREARERHPLLAAEPGPLHAGVTAPAPASQPARR